MTIKIYLDHNIIRFLVRTFPAGINESKERCAFERMRGQHPNVRFIISHWSMIEAARGGDEARVKDCAALIAGLRPLIIRDKSGMAREELRCHAYFTFYGKRCSPPNMFYESYPLALYDLGVHDAAILGHSIEADILATFRNPHWLNPIAKQENALPNALRVLADAKHDKSLTPEIRAESMRQWLLQFFPERDPAHAPISPIDRDRMVLDLVHRGKETYRACPSLHVEDELSEFRISNKERDPERQDAIDLMMAVPALAYCDAFVSYDGYIAEGAATLSRKKTIACLVARLPSEVTERFGI